MAKGDGSRFTDVETPQVTREEIYSMLRGLLRNSNLLQDAIRLGLDPAHFNGPGETVFYYLFGASRNLFQKHGALTEEMLTTELRAWQQVGAMPLPAQELAFLFGDEENPGCIKDIFNAPKLEVAEERANREYIEGILRRFMNARMIQQQIQAALAGSATGGAPVGLEARLTRWARDAQAVEFIGRQVSNAAVMPEFGSPIILPPPPVPTSIPIFDEYIGGFRPRDIIGLLGPFSGGKTTLMAVTAVRMAQNFASRGENKLSVYICYEDDSSKMNHLFWSAAASVERKIFEDNEKFWEDFSNKDNLKDYDRRLPENKNGKIVFGERERWDMARPWLNRHFVFLDFSANKAAGSLGSGGVAEVVATLSRLADDRQMEIGFVAIDYAGLMINRELGKDSRTKNMEQVWRPMQQLPDDIRTNIAVPFDATVMLAHQLAGNDIKKIPPHRYVSHLDASGSKSFAENLHACVCINTRDTSSLVSTINWSKIRSRVPKTPFGLIRMDEHVVGIHLVNHLYTVDESSRRIIKRGEEGFVSPTDISSVKRSGSSSKGMRGIDNYGTDILEDS